MKKTPTTQKLGITLYFTFISFLLMNAQSTDYQKIDTIINNDNKELYRETVYSHINKSTYIKGEEIGFTSYVFNKKTKTPSQITKNLYFVITDSNDRIVKENLFKVENGFASGNIRIDSVFTTGIYKVKTFTNWMLNFKEQNYFVETIKIIDSNKPSIAKKTIQNNTIDIQFLSESGAFLEETLNTVGIIAKDSLGYGMPNVTGEIFENNIKITNFNLNNLGIGRVSFTPYKNKTYTAIINYNGHKIKKLITTNAQKNGILLNVTKNNENAFISIVTNASTLATIKNKSFNLIIHQGEDSKKLNIQFQNKQTISKKIKLDDLGYGINIVTLVDQNNNPIAERLFFNYHGLNILDLKKTAVLNIKDSVDVSFKFEDYINFKDNNLSISVLPKGTKSYHKNSNIISQTLLNPYLKGTVENGGYYFNEINSQKEYDLDNLLITQGWSSYDWKDMSNNNVIASHQFENGISIKVNIPNLEKESSYLIHHISNKSGNILTFLEEIKSFQLYSYFPENKENLYISKIGNHNSLLEPSLYLQYYPNHIPKLNSDANVLNPNNLNNSAEINFDVFPDFYALNKKNTLNEIIITANIKEQRKEKIQNSSMGRVYFLSSFDKNYSLADYLNSKSNILARDDFRTGQFTAINRAVGSNIAFFLDDFLVLDTSLLFYYRLFDVEYIDINLNDMTGGLAVGRGGVVRIKTDPLSNISDKKTVREFKFPVTFTASKKFYVPKYHDFKNEFFKSYGVIDWFPKNKINADGTLKIKFKNTLQNQISLFLEGITGDGKFISKEITINVPENIE
ncbi:hypothetical protein [uncultured Polaribacter sp.]|uniref:hypothetical protein n=1 Tax=uncultured Polaribacter sp. TaxID=174711 RepID=UPI0030D9B403|tara:strand:- start:3921 stop:6308 length:2388 start_codon:yes stop_codon:yes gene_type:complete